MSDNQQQFNDYSAQLYNNNRPISGGQEWDAFALQKKYFRIDSTEDTPFSLNGSETNTKSVGGIELTDEGKLYIQADKNSIEVVGQNITSGTKEPAKIIHAKKGDIVLQAVNGDIILEANNILIYARDAKGGIVTLKASKLVETLASIINNQGDNFTVAAAQGTSISGGGTMEIQGEISVDIGQSTDAARASFLGKLLAAIERFKNFFGSNCST